MNEEEVSKLRYKLRAARQHVEDKGWSVANGMVTNNCDKTCCILGMFRIVNDNMYLSDGYVSIAAHALDITREQAQDVEAGFMRPERMCFSRADGSPRDEALVALGLEFRP